MQMIKCLALFLLVVVATASTAHSREICVPKAASLSSSPPTPGLRIELYQAYAGQPWTGCLMIDNCRWRSDAAQEVMPLPPDYFITPEQTGALCRYIVSDAGVAIRCPDNAGLGPLLGPVQEVLKNRLGPTCRDEQGMARLTYGDEAYLSLPIVQQGACFLLLVRLSDGAQLLTLTPSLGCGGASKAIELAQPYLNPNDVTALAADDGFAEYLVLRFSLDSTGAPPELAYPVESPDGFISGTWLPAIATLKAENPNLSTEAERPFSSQAPTEIGYYFPFLLAAVTRMLSGFPFTEDATDVAAINWMSELAMSDTTKFSGVFFRAELLP